MRTRGPGESALRLFDVVAELGTRSVDYAGIGAMAASVHGLVRASIDAGAVLALPVPALADLARALSAVGFRTTLRHGEPDDPIAALERLLATP